jgi:hypothetical protein
MLSNAPLIYYEFILAGVALDPKVNCHLRKTRPVGLLNRVLLHPIRLVLCQWTFHFV